MIKVAEFFDIDNVDSSCFKDMLTDSEFELDRGDILEKSLREETITGKLYDISVKSGCDDQQIKKFILKNSNSDYYEWGCKEVEFYSKQAEIRDDLPLPMCFSAGLDKENKSTYILLENVEDNYFSYQWPLPPIKIHCAMAVESLAQVHARWWGLDEKFKLPNPPDKKNILDNFKNIADQVSKFSDFLGDRLTKKRKDTLIKVLEVYPNIVADRLSNKESLTFKHGDAHLWNFMYPKNIDDKCILLDWQTWHTGVGAVELAYMIAVHFYSSQRKELEQYMLNTYFETLTKNGVINYSSKQLHSDYVMGVIGHLFTPVRQFSFGVDPEVWWPHLDRVFCAYEELNCESYLDSYFSDISIKI